MDHDVDPVESAPEPALVANVPKKEAKSPVNQGRLHLVLLELVPTEHDDPLRLVMR